MHLVRSGRVGVVYMKLALHPSAPGCGVCGGHLLHGRGWDSVHVCVWERVFTSFSTVYHCAFVWGLGKPLIICDLSGGLLLVHARVWWLEWRTWALERQRRQRRWTTVMSVSGWHGISSCLAVVYCCNRLHTPRWAGRSLRTETQTNFLRLSPICLGWRGRKGGLGSGWRVRFVIKVE